MIPLLLKNFSKRLVIALIYAASFFCIPNSPYAQSGRVGGEERPRGLERLDDTEGLARIEAFRNQRLEGSFCFRFQLAHKPYRSSRTVRYDGILWGSWNAQGPVTRFHLYPLAEGNDIEEEGEALQWIVQGGREPSVWFRSGTAAVFETLGSELLFQPLFEGVIFRPFDLQMPFIYWENFEYEGPGRMGTYAAVQNFLMLPPQEPWYAKEGIGGVRLSIDDDYNALRRVEVLDSADQVISEFTASGFKKVQDQWIVSQIILKVLPSKERTDFRVMAAAVGLAHNRAWFDPELKILPVVPPSDRFDEL